MNEKLLELIKLYNLSKNHNDGGCFKLTIGYTDFEDVPFENHIMYGENFDDLLTYAEEFKAYQEENGRYVIDFRIQDDSK